LSERPITAWWPARRAFIPYVTAGFPTAVASREALRRVAAAGADVVEVGVPFSDPLADGPTIQRTTQVALEQGMTAAGVLALIREAALAVPVVIMTYLNPVLAYAGGLERFVADAHAAGAAALLLTDLPAGADPAVEDAVTRSPLALIRLVAPTTDDARLRVALAGATGFVYLVSRLGVTGARDQVPPDLEAQVRRVHAATPLPIAVGFGISTPAQAAGAARYADGVVVGSALMDALARDGADALERSARELAAAVHG